MLQCDKVEILDKSAIGPAQCATYLRTNSTTDKYCLQYSQSRGYSSFDLRPAGFGFLLIKVCRASSCWNCFEQAWFRGVGHCMGFVERGRVEGVWRLVRSRGCKKKVRSVIQVGHQAMNKTRQDHVLRKMPRVIFGWFFVWGWGGWSLGKAGRPARIRLRCQPKAGSLKWSGWGYLSDGLSVSKYICGGIGWRFNANGIQPAVCFFTSSNFQWWLTWSPVAMVIRFLLLWTPKYRSVPE